MLPRLLVGFEGLEILSSNVFGQGNRPASSVRNERRCGRSWSPALTVDQTDRGLLPPLTTVRHDGNASQRNRLAADQISNALSFGLHQLGR